MEQQTKILAFHYLICTIYRSAAGYIQFLKMEVSLTFLKIGFTLDSDLRP